MDFSNIRALNESREINFVVESPKGSTIKYKYAPEMSGFTISRPLVCGIHYPHNWGFVPSTQMPDGDPLDALLLFDEPFLRGTVVPSRAIAVLKVDQKSKKENKRERNDRLLLVPANARRTHHLKGLQNIAEGIKMEIEEFFKAVVALENKDIHFLGWGNAKEAMVLIKKASKRDE